MGFGLSNQIRAGQGAVLKAGIRATLNAVITGCVDFHEGQGGRLPHTAAEIDQNYLKLVMLLLMVGQVE